LYKILVREDLVPGIHLFKVAAPAVAQKARAGQFVVVRIDEKGERIPLTIADWDKDKGTVTIVFMEVGATTARLALLKEGDAIADFVGPLGVPAEIENYGTVVCVAGGVGTAVVAPIARALKQAGNKIITILGTRSKDLLFWEDVLKSTSDRMIVTTDDGSYGRKGVVTEPLKELLESGEKIDRVVAIGPVVMMKFCSLTTAPSGAAAGCRLAARPSSPVLTAPILTGIRWTGICWRPASVSILTKRSALTMSGRKATPLERGE
jgi:NAD(P)H-flavin reductase